MGFLIGDLIGGLIGELIGKILEIQFSERISTPLYIFSGHFPLTTLAGLNYVYDPNLEF
jgi:hypothetical protein